MRDPYLAARCSATSIAGLSRRSSMFALKVKPQQATFA